MKTRMSSMVAVVGLVLGLGASQVQAGGFTVLWEDNNATGILNLDVDGTLFNVDFVYGAAEDLYPGNDWDLTNPEAALVAGLATAAALDSVEEVWTVGPMMSDNFSIPNDVEGPLALTLDFEYIGGTWESTGAGANNLAEDASYARYTIVPTPGALCLLGAAFAVRGGRRRKRTA